MGKYVYQHHEYDNWAEFITIKIKLAQTNAAIKVNSEMLTFHASTVFLNAI